MAKRIASFIDEEGNITPLNNSGNIVVYKKYQGQWELETTKPFTMDGIKNMAQLRDIMGAIINSLGDCKTFIGQSVSGVPYFEFEKAGINIWEFEGTPTDYLEHVYKQELLEQSELEITELRKKQQLEAIGPKDFGNGHYQVSLTKIQGNNLGITSKQVLLPILKKGLYYKLEVYCSHIPPWLEAEIVSRALSSKIERINEKELRVLITKKICK
ncbi:Fe-only nitrogenase accessory AnfO family protein [Desulfuribacillus alkaliarsenatis]|uniref:Fe-only nitrogenase accessory protein AnfO n=1 Tax=Desulfuribacillus alkaliarsenatis TaxID=766136 RepID=A0A1E5G0C2_9FIRM|nr:Fe-only nitrogenase accessory AnfO family protein [Desulfuribacillus alkaliarsenatis]OEF96264.1 hypothetical protein BHF68_08875 [Desulfuribacillus alkaliarsenatis]